MGMGIGMGNGGCSMHSEAKFSVSITKHAAMHYEALFYTKVHRSGAQLRFQIRQQRGANVQRNDNGLRSHYWREAMSSSDFRFKRNGHFFNGQDGTSSSCFVMEVIRHAELIV